MYSAALTRNTDMKIKTILLFLLLHIICVIKCANITVGAEVEDNNKREIEDLEKQKTEIYNQINDAVNDTIKTLKNSNDSDAKQGIAYMQELIALIHNFSDAEFAKPNTVCNGSDCTIKTIELKTPKSLNISVNGTRRAGRNTGHDHIKQAIIKSGVFKKSDDIEKARNEKVQNLLVLQGKLDKWLKIREVEKQKIKQYKLRQISHRHQTLTEECPNYGDKKPKKGKKGGGKSNKYPCCRKCCKTSYMGCL
ncbi:hypothetical protein PYW08_010281 [Mythimna loreyi]|uniref:Uncharacterized protein n=1 Tax=Mythimna loreyi TaxID=667449 RepID=A0ACC2Q416_9NEOP|nr:hypothetical protein PYW08_010281 [Mythimna loreyi]